MPNRTPAETAAFLEEQAAWSPAWVNDVMKRSEEKTGEEDTDNLLSEENIKSLGEKPKIFKSFDNINTIACNYKKFVAAIKERGRESDRTKTHLILHVQSMLLSYCLNSVYSTTKKDDKARISFDVAKNFFGNIDNIDILKKYDFLTDEKYKILLDGVGENAFGTHTLSGLGFFPKLSGGHYPAKTSLINITTGLLSCNNPPPPSPPPPSPPPPPPPPGQRQAGRMEGESGEGGASTGSLELSDRDGGLAQAEVYKRELKEFLEAKEAKEAKAAKEAKEAKAAKEAKEAKEAQAAKEAKAAKEAQAANVAKAEKKASGGSKRKSKKTKRRKIKRRRHTKKKRVKRRKYSLKK